MDIHIAVMIGSIRKERFSDRPAHALVAELEKQGAQVTVLDLQELNLPMFDDGIDHHGKTKLLETYQEMDGMIIVTPEYNHGVPSPVKNAIDYARNKEIVGKPMTAVGTSRGAWGGTRVIGPLCHVWLGAGGIAIPLALQTPNVQEFDSQNPPELWQEGAKTFVQKTMHWFGIMKAGKAAMNS